LEIVEENIMADIQVKVYYDREGNTLTVWFGDTTDEYVAEETGERLS